MHEFPPLDREGRDKRWAKYMVDVPTGERGEFKIVHREVGVVEQLHDMLRGRGTPPGTYTVLLSKTALWMSDTRAEIYDHMAAIHWMEGTKYRPPAEHVLLHGLGIGVVLKAAIMAGCSEIDVVEIEEDVIALVGEHYEKMAADAGVQLAIHHDDALTKKWPVGMRWNVVWHDIWPSISESNLETMATLHRRFGGRCEWQGSWCRDVVRGLREGRWS